MEDLLVTIGRTDFKSGKAILENMQVFHDEQDLVKYLMENVVFKSQADNLNQFIQKMKSIEENHLSGLAAGCRCNKDKLIELFNQVVHLKYSATTMPCYIPFKKETNELVVVLNRMREKMLKIFFNEMEGIVVYKKCVTMNGERNSMYIANVVFTDDIKVCVDL
jgi:hypothetical protein